MSLLARRQRIRVLRSVIPALVALCSSGSPLSAQEYGRWWWDARAGWRTRDNSTEIDGASASDYGEREARVELSLNGFLGHPAIGRFRVGVDAARQDLSGGVGVDSKEIGWHADVDILPRGPAPLSLSYRRGGWSYEPGANDPAYVLASSVDTVDSWRGRLRLNRGWLTGVVLGVDGSRARYVEPSPKPERDERQFLAWSRRIGAFDNTLRIDRDDHTFGRIGLDNRYTTATFDQVARFDDRWDWQLGAVAFRAASSYQGLAEQSQQELRLMQVIQRRIRGRDSLDLRFDVRSTDASTSPSTGGRRLGLAYRWRPLPGAEIAPLVESGELHGGDSRERFSRTGVALSWNRNARLDWMFSGEATWGSYSREGPGAPDENDVALAASLTVGAGRPERLRREIEIAASRNDLRFDAASVAGLPPAEAALLQAAFGRQDSARVKLRLDHQGAKAGLGGWIEARRATIETVAGASSEFDTLSLTLQGTWHQVSLVANAGDVDQSLPGQDTQNLRYVGASFEWRILRGLTLSAHHREDRRNLLLLPTLEARRDEIGVDFQLGLLRIYASFYEADENFAASGHRIDHGLQLSITRDFAGWLPIVTGSRRRGEIR